MYKILIMDDERQIREGIMKIIPWEQYGFKICAEASNGVEGLKKIEQHCPHVVFVDIRMPVMDGIEFLQELRKRKLHCETVVLSGFNDYDLVRRAMKLGAIDYLTKPFGKDEIIQALEDITERIEMRRVDRLEYDKNMELMRNSLMNRMIHNQITSMELRNCMEMLEMKIPSGECRIAVIQGREDVTMPEQPYIYPFRDGQGYLCLFAYGQENPEYERKLRILLREIIDKSTDKSGIKITAALGVKVKTYRSIRQSYESALKTLEYQFVFGEGNLLDAEEIHAYFGKQDNKLCVDGKEFRDLMDKENREEIKHYILSIFQEYNSKTAVADTFVLKNCALELVILAFQRLDSLSFTESGDIYHMKAEAMKEIENARTLDEMQQIILRHTDKILDKARKSRDKTYSRFVADAVQHIYADYADKELSLKSLADMMHVNAAYLGRIFKKEIGSSFADYLNHVRIEKAKDLLSSSNYKGSELCEKVGFSNYNYFYIVFKKITGIKPTEYRNS